MSGRAGVLLALGAYGMWGLFPLYFRLLESAGAVEIVLHRIVWSLLTCLVVLAVTRSWQSLRHVSRRQLGLLAAAAAAISLNWGVFIWAVNSEQVVETSLGYFVNPLVSVLLGVLLLRERLRRTQWAAVGIAGAAVAVLTVDYGRPPWIALALAASFGTYGLLKNLVGRGVGALPGLTLETAVLAPPALALLVWLQVQGSGTFTSAGPWHTALLVASGALTAAPLLLFAAGTRRIDLSLVGMLQFITPVMQFVVGWALLGEPMPLERWIGFTIVWIAIVVFVADLLINSRRTHTGSPVTAPVDLV